MAGIAVPTPLLLFVLTMFSIARFACNIPIPVERVIIFPMAIDPPISSACGICSTWPRTRAPACP